MNLDQYEYSIGGIKAVEIYPFSKKVKRYFRGYRMEAPHHLYRIVVYDYALVKEEPLIETLNSLRGIEHVNLGKILNIYQEITMVKAGLKPSEEKIKEFREKIIAVILEDNQQGEYINIFDFVVQMGTLSEALAQFFAFTLLNLIKSMQSKGFKNCFNSNNVLIERNTGLIKIDNYGDSVHFVIREQNVSDSWELGEFLFTLLKKCPPFIKKSQSDPRFNLLTKNDFEKFWSTFPNKPIKNPSHCASEFINQCFKKETSVETLSTCEWLNEYVPLSEEERIHELSALAQQKQERMQNLSSKQNDRKEKILKAARESTNLAHQRGTQPEFIENFLDNYFREEQHNRFHTEMDNEEERESERIRIADVLTNLKTSSNNEVRISNVIENGNTINFKIKVDLEEILMEETEVELQIQKHNKKIVFVIHKIDAPFYQSLWINNYLREHLLEN